jgi:hypothetical protein
LKRQKVRFWFDRRRPPAPDLNLSTVASHWSLQCCRLAFHFWGIFEIPDNLRFGLRTPGKSSCAIYNGKNDDSRTASSDAAVSAHTEITFQYCRSGLFRQLCSSTRDVPWRTRNGWRGDFSQSLCQAKIASQQRHHVCPAARSLGMSIMNGLINIGCGENGKISCDARARFANSDPYSRQGTLCSVIERFAFTFHCLLAI